MITLETYNDIRHLIFVSIRTNIGTWWADSLLGSSIYHLGRRQEGDEPMSAHKLKTALEEALQWIVEEHLAKSIEVSTEILENNYLGWTVLVTKHNGQTFSLKEFYHAK